MIPRCHAVTEPRPAFAGLPVRGQILLGGCLCAGAGAFLFSVDPSRHAVYPECLFHRTTGLYCAGCGATRALYALLHGRVLLALHDNALLVTALPFLLAAGGMYLWESWRARAWAETVVEGRTLRRAGVWLFALLLVFTIARNLPGPDFAWLRPLAG